MKSKTLLLVAFTAAIVSIGVLATVSMLPASEYHPTNDDTWSTNLESSLDRAQAEDKLVLVYVWSPSCSHCEEFTAQLQQESALQAEFDTFVLVSKQYEQASQFRSAYPISGTPTLLVLNSRGEAVDSFIPTRVNDPATTLEGIRERVSESS